MTFFMWFLVVVAAEAVTEILVASDLLVVPRAWLARQHILLELLVGCGYCVSVWVSMIFVWALPSLFDHWYIDIVVKWFAVHRLSNWFHALMVKWLSRDPWMLVLHKVDGNEKRSKRA